MKQQGKVLQDFFDSLNKAIMGMVAIITWSAQVKLIWMMSVSARYIFLTRLPLPSQVHSGGHLVPDYGEDLRNEGPGRDGQPVGDVHRLCDCGPRHPRPRRSAAALLRGDQVQSVPLHWRTAAGPPHRSGNIVQVLLILRFTNFLSQ